MSTDTQKYSESHDREAQHSAFREFGRDERRPAVLLLAGLVIATLFFALGIIFGRWTTREDSPIGAPQNQPAKAAPINRAVPTPTLTPSPTPAPSSSATPTKPKPRQTPTNP